jgi:hypothetical protein
MGFFLEKYLVLPQKGERFTEPMEKHLAEIG